MSPVFTWRAISACTLLTFARRGSGAGGAISLTGVAFASGLKIGVSSLPAPLMSTPLRAVGRAELALAATLVAVVRCARRLSERERIQVGELSAPRGETNLTICGRRNDLIGHPLWSRRGLGSLLVAHLSRLGWRR